MPIKLYDKVMGQKSFKEFKALIEKWTALSENLQKSIFNAPIMLPDIFLISDSGMGRTSLLEVLSDFLYHKENLMDFYGDVRYFEFKLNYCKPDQPFSEILRLMSEVRIAAGFRNEYRGIAYIEIDEWIEHCQEKHFLDFLEYLSDNSDKWLVVLSISKGKKEKMDELRGVVSAFLRTESITINAPSADEFAQYLYDMIFAYGLEVEQEARDILVKTVKVLGKTKYFDGYKTVKLLAQDIVYSVFSKAKNKATVTAEDVKEFSEESEYVTRTLKNIAAAKQRIGF